MQQTAQKQEAFLTDKLNLDDGEEDEQKANDMQIAKIENGHSSSNHQMMHYAGKPHVHEDIYGLLDTDDVPKCDLRDLYDEGMVDIARLEGAGSFGELALIDGKPRFATAKCTERTHFLVISVDDFKKAQEKIKMNERDKKVEFLKNKVPLFIESRPSNTVLRKLALAFETLKCTKDSILIREGDIANKVFIIQEGEFVVTKKIYSKNVETEDVEKIK